MGKLCIRFKSSEHKSGTILEYIINKRKYHLVIGREMTITSILLLLLLLLPTVSAAADALTSPSSTQTRACNSLMCQVQDAKVKLSQLESGFEKSIQDLNAKSLYVKEFEKKIDGMVHDIHLLKIALASLEDSSSHANEKLSALEGELQLLWSISRKNNFEIYTLECKARDAEKRLKLLSSQVEKMAEIVSEQWIQIQQLEQAVQMTQVRASKCRRQLSTARCPFVRFVNNLLGEHLEMSKGILNPYVANGRSVLEKALQYSKRTFSAAKHYHHQLQGYIKQSLLRSEFTSILANEEVVFIVASALIMFPILSICMMFPSHFS